MSCTCNCLSCREQREYKRPPVVNVFVTENAPQLTCLVLKETECGDYGSRRFTLRITRGPEAREVVLSYDALTCLHRGIGDLL